MSRKIIALSAAVVCLAACESTSAIPYQPSTQNVIAAQRVLQPANATVAVGSFSAAEGVAKPTCRMAGQLDIAPGKDVPTFIRDAFESELFMSGAYAAEGVQISGHVEDLQVNTFGTGSWTITLALTSPSNPTGYRVTTTHEFASSFSAYSACQNAVTAFNPAVAALLGQAINDPNFASVAGVR